MTDVAEPSESAARDQLAAVDVATARTTAVLARSGRVNGVFLCALGLLFGGLVAGVGFTEHSSPAGLIVSIFAFGAIMQVVMFWRQKTKTATSREWARRSGWAFGLTVALYVVGVLLAALGAVGPSPAFWIPYAIATALPAVAVGLADVRS